MTTVPASEPMEVARGGFISRDHATSGIARILELPDGRRVVRLERLDTDNGPDLYLYLGTNPADGAEGAFDDDYVNLGRLEGNQGDQNYDLPEGTDVARHATVVIWARPDLVDERCELARSQHTRTPLGESMPPPRKNEARCREMVVLT